MTAISALLTVFVLDKSKTAACRNFLSPMSPSNLSGTCLRLSLKSAQSHGPCSHRIEDLQHIPDLSFPSPYACQLRFALSPKAFTSLSERFF